MDMRSLSADFSVSGQIMPHDISELVGAGIKVIVDNRPDGEIPPDLQSAVMADLVMTAGLAFHYVPIVPGQCGVDEIARMKQILAEAAGPVLAYCRSGARSTHLWSLSADGHAG